MAATSYHKDGHFNRLSSQFRDLVSPDPASRFPAEKGRYALYVSPTSPWAHRTMIARILKGLEEIVDLYQVHHHLGPQGWYFSGKEGSLPKDPLYGFTLLRDLYLKADPSFSGRVTVPLLWDKKTHTIVNNESSEIIRILTSAFDHLLPSHLREVNRPGGGLYPSPLRQEIDNLNSWIYNLINDGVYHVGFAATQESYDAHLYPLFDALDRVEQILSSDGRKYLVGEHLTEADVRLYTTIVRFDVVYHPIFQCNLKSIRHDYPAMYLWLRRLYWDGSSEGEKGSDLTRGAFYKTTAPNFANYAIGYVLGRRFVVFDNQGPVIVPRGPKVFIDALLEVEG
ncbi:glutathione transferase [Podospora aff. communis PSN243]|uniref:Glutathione transferase n=1 Tax=Podospora aff. communis PSN243 TaxID=3040156 RepID=A0AAV9GG31_9PEZI|nr:glutathione transferase [Podospora aff. communis PSN243]